MPTSTDLVTDLPADFETFGQAVDTSLADLKGGTSGQILSKASNTDMDFTWITNDVGDITAVTAGTGISGGGTSGAVTITNSMATAIDAKGDLVVGTGADAFSRLAVGANDLLLTAASGEATGLKYAGGWTTWTPTLSGMTLGNGTTVARYCQIGKTVFFGFYISFGSTSSTTGDFSITMPINPSSVALMNISSVAANAGSYYPMVPFGYATNQVFVRASNASSTYGIGTALSSTIPFTWTTNSFLQIAGSYEVA